MSTPTDTAASPAAPKPIRIAPIVTPDAKFFWEGADREEFLGQKCSDCHKFRFPPRPMCPYCHSLKREEVPLSGYGTVHAWTVPRHPPPFGFREAPIVAVIDLQEGIRFVSNVVGISIEEMQQDLPVEVTFEPTMNKHKVPVFKPRAL
ncbi:MAG: Zn-ribbon domain-containing OB-fold protein [Stenotrophobium sp.]